MFASVAILEDVANFQRGDVDESARAVARGRVCTNTVVTCDI